MNRGSEKIFILIFFFAGLVMISFSIVNNVINYNKYKDYVPIKATYGGISSKYNSEGTTMYYLDYYYIVGDDIYVYTTDYSVSSLPKEGSCINIKYNYNNPSENYRSSFNKYSVLFAVGMIFVCGSLIMLFSEFIWLRDILMSFISIYFTITFISNGMDTGAFIFLFIIMAVFLIVSVADFILSVKQGKIHPLSDIKNEIRYSNILRQEKKKNKLKMSKLEKK